MEMKGYESVIMGPYTGQGVSRAFPEEVTFVLKVAGGGLAKEGSAGPRPAKQRCSVASRRGVPFGSQVQSSPGTGLVYHCRHCIVNLTGFLPHTRGFRSL